MIYIYFKYNLVITDKISSGVGRYQAVLFQAVWFRFSTITKVVVQN